MKHAIKQKQCNARVKSKQGWNCTRECSDGDSVLCGVVLILVNNTGIPPVMVLPAFWPAQKLKATALLLCLRLRGSSMRRNTTRGFEEEVGRYRKSEGGITVRLVGLNLRLNRLQLGELATVGCGGPFLTISALYRREGNLLKNTDITFCLK